MFQSSLLRLTLPISISAILHVGVATIVAATPTDARNTGVGSLTFVVYFSPTTDEVHENVALADAPPPAPTGPTLPQKESNGVKGSTVRAAVAQIPLQLPDIDANHYYRPDEIQIKAVPTNQVDLEVPPTAPGVDYFGTVKLLVRIDDRGNVDDVTVLASTVPTSFQESAAKAFRDTKFEPARKAGLRVKSEKIIEVTYEAPSR